MHLIFERGDRDRPVGHAFVYFRDDTGAILATYVNVPPIEFDLTKFMPQMFAGMLQGMDLADQSLVAPIPPLPEEVPGVEHLQSLAARRNDDLVYAGATMRSDPMRLMHDAQEAAAEYGQLYKVSPLPSAGEALPETPTKDADELRFAGLSERERLDELTTLTGRLRDSLREGRLDTETERQMRKLAGLLPAKYRADELVNAARLPGDRGQRLAGLHLERSYKLFHEDYLDLERIDREIAAIAD